MNISDITSVPNTLLLYLILKELRELRKVFEGLGKVQPSGQTTVVREYYYTSQNPSGTTETISFSNIEEILKGTILVSVISDPLVASLYKDEIGAEPYICDFRETINPSETKTRTFNVGSGYVFIIREIRVRCTPNISIEIELDGQSIPKIPTSEAAVENPIVMPIYKTANNTVEIKATNLGTSSETANVELIGVKVSENVLENAKEYLRNIISGVI